MWHLCRDRLLGAGAHVLVLCVARFVCDILFLDFLSCDALLAFRILSRRGKFDPGMVGLVGFTNFFCGSVSSVKLSCERVSIYPTAPALSS